MATNPKSDLPQEEIQKLDNLTIIPGVNEALGQWLRESLKVYTFADLAKLSAQKIRARGKQTGEVLSIEELEPVLARAKELADAASAESPLPTRAKPEKAAASTKTAKEWNDFANFVICFERKTAGGKEEKRTKIEHRTGIEHMETSERESWPGIETDDACRWMLTRLGDKTSGVAKNIVESVVAPAIEETPDDATLPPAIKASYVSPGATLEITGIQVIQPISSDQPHSLFTQNQSFNGFVKSDEPLSFAIIFQLKGEGAVSIAQKRAEYTAVIHSQDLFTSVTSQLGVSEPGRMTIGQLTYIARFSPLRVSPGAYHLKVTVTVRDTPPLWASAEAPLLQTV
ncbi:MAG: hypothetical protein ACKVZH_07930 [Blastocatellia bacterium]